MEPPRKPPLVETRGRSPSTHGLSAIREEDGRPHERRSTPAPEPVGSDREFILQTLRAQLGAQTEEITGKIVASEERTNEKFRVVDARFLEFERARIEDRESRLAMQEMTGQVRQLLNHERAQDLDIGALQARVATSVAASIRPQVLADATTEGQAAGHTAGKRAGRFWGILGMILATVFTSALGYCEHQIENGAFTAPKK